MASSMLNSSPLQIPCSRSRRLLRLLIAVGILSTIASAQTLARPGWVGSGLTPNSWWRHAVLYEIDPHNFQDSNADGTGDLRGITQSIDYLQSLGVDALLLQHLQPASANPSADQANTQFIDPSLGTLDDLDDLIIQSSRHNIRVLIELQPTSPAADLSGVARFWLSRGIAGFRLAPPSAQATPQDSATQLLQLRAAAKSYVGERVLIGDLPPSAAALPARNHPVSSPRNADIAQLLLNPYLSRLTQLDTAALRTAMDDNDASIHLSGSAPLVITDDSAQVRSLTRFAAGKNDQDIAKIIATLLLTTRGSAMLRFGQEIGLPAASTAEQPTTLPWGQPTTSTTASSATTTAAKPRPAPQPAATTSDRTVPDIATQDAGPGSLLNWYRQLSILQHSNLTLRSGTNLSLNHDDQHVLAWVRKPQSVSSISPPIVFLCNLSAQPVQLSLRADILRLHLRGNFLRTILRSDNGMGALHLDPLTLPPFAVYIGELRY